jgi:hypothetical protein
MATDQILRLHYFERQYLGAADLEDQQTYLRDMRRRHNVGHHTWGIVTGLELVEQPVAGDPSAVNIFIQPGMAIDGFGREIIVMAPVQLDSSLFQSFGTSGATRHSVWIGYDQQQAQTPAAGFAQCDVTSQYARVLETYKFAIDADANPPTHQDVSVDGSLVDPTNDPAIPQDQSVPYQEFPDDATDPLWLIQLGSVLWDGGQRKFVPPNDKSLYMQGRSSFAGIVAQAVYNPAPQPDRDPSLPDDPNLDPATLVIEPRFPPKNLDAAGFVEIRGRLQVDGRIVAKKDVRLWGGKLYFLDKGGQTDNVPLWIERRANTGGGTDLRMHIGPDNSDSERLSIGTGPDDDSAEHDILAIRGSNNVDIPSGFLNFDPPGLNLRQMLNLWKLNYGIGVQNGNMYYRTDSGFRWYQGGKHSNDPSSADNGTLLLSVDGGGSLSVTKDINLPGNIYFGTQTRQMLNLWDVRYGIGVQAFTLYFRTDTDFCWFRGGSHSDNRDDPGGGVLAMMLDPNSKLTVTGDLATHGNLSVSGNAGINGTLNVGATQNLVDVFTQTLAVQNNGNNFATWTVSHSNRFSSVYARFAVFQGFSIFGQGGNISFNNFGRVPDVNAIPQHSFVRVDSGDNDHTNGTCFCSESSAANETDNTVLFTVVVIGKPINPR